MKKYLNKIRNNKGFVVLFQLYVFLMIGDIVTTLMNHELIPYLELNSVYRLTNSMAPVIMLNALVTVLIPWLYLRSRSKPGERFLITNVMVIISAVRVFAIKNAISWITKPPIPVETLKEIVTPEFIQAQQIQLAINIYLPLMLTLVVFLFWKWDHNIKKKEEEEEMMFDDVRGIL